MFQTKATTRIACNTEQYHDMNDHIMIDDKLKEAIFIVFSLSNYNFIITIKINYTSS